MFRFLYLKCLFASYLFLVFFAQRIYIFHVVEVLIQPKLSWDFQDILDSIIVISKNYHFSRVFHHRFLFLIKTQKNIDNIDLRIGSSYFTCISLVYMVGFSLIVYMFDFIFAVKSFFFL